MRHAPALPGIADETSGIDCRIDIRFVDPLVECWEDDVPNGEITDLRKAVKANDDESVVFSWIEWPDKATRDAGMKKMMSDDFSDERMDPREEPRAV